MEKHVNRLNKAILKMLSNAYINIKKHYKLYRKILNVANPYIKPIYHALDRKIMVLDREIPVRVFYPKQRENAKVLIFFHGGGWVTGNIDTYTHICANMARQTKQTVVSVNYRLAPENPFPAGLEDCYYVTKEIFSYPELLGCKREDITLVGDSAGGNLAAVVSLMARDKGEFLPSKQILIYPATHFDHSVNAPFDSVREFGSDYIMTAERIENYMELYLQNGEDRRNPYVAPILADDLFNQPKTLMITAEYDPLRDEGEAYGMKLRAFHNQVHIFRMKETIHGFLAFPKNTKSVKECYEHMNRFLNDVETEGDGL